VSAVIWTLIVPRGTARSMQQSQSQIDDKFSRLGQLTLSTSSVAGSVPVSVIFVRNTNSQKKKKKTEKCTKNPKQPPPLFARLVPPPRTEITYTLFRYVPGPPTPSPLPSSPHPSVQTVHISAHDLLHPSIGSGTLTNAIEPIGREIHTSFRSLGLHAFERTWLSRSYARWDDPSPLVDTGVYPWQDETRKV
jgi:hypothetical protein